MATVVVFPVAAFVSSSRFYMASSFDDSSNLKQPRHW